MTDLKKRIKELEAKGKASNDSIKNKLHHEAFGRIFDALRLALPEIDLTTKERSKQYPHAIVSTGVRISFIEQLHALNARQIIGQSTPDDLRVLDQLQINDLAVIELRAEEIVEMICKLDLAY